MSKNTGQVSVWAGYFDNEDEFFSYVEKTYEGDSVSSRFISDLNVQWYDEDFAEGVYLDRDGDIESALGELSWGASFVHNLAPAIDLNKVNSVYVVYDFDGSPTAAVTGAPLSFLGVYEYRKS
ncbi:immunity 22 family protein [Xanthomonas sp. AmX2]|uniref:immunity 22 family protein n=1 Tax=Xanthomonas sp. TaxID=29446 RepID=UPI0019817CB2|nr:immunity 22 family protein [Xanthomonas sp.]MBN6150907.1 immunity 22 family protein [Xanthomonas sp.]